MDLGNKQVKTLMKCRNETYFICLHINECGKHSKKIAVVSVAVAFEAWLFSLVFF